VQQQKVKKRKREKHANTQAMTTKQLNENAEKHFV